MNNIGNIVGKMLIQTLCILSLFGNIGYAQSNQQQPENYVLLAAEQSSSQGQSGQTSTALETIYPPISPEIRAVLESTGVTEVQDWSALGSTTTGFTLSQSTFHPQAINPYDLQLINMRSDMLAPGFIVAFFGMIVVFTLFSVINGASKVQGGMSGKSIKRWSTYDVFIHWLCALPCILLIFSGMTLLAGRYYIEPNVGNSTWASMIYYAKASHDVLVYPFVIGWLLICVSWLKDQWPKMYDISWFKAGGGYINFGPMKGKHPDSGFVNAGEKIWFWCLALAGVLLVASGIVLMFPTQLDVSRTLSVLALIVHASSALVIAAFAVVHIFMATVLAPGTLSAMTTGYVDENWAKQHHNLWFDEINANNTIEYKK
ncbi:formate dehydrogenase subunit gamma [Thalassotalea sp. Y01]|uniref:formate dehydrogenase subunit gamma n=1 Tax=Thalassotalea sp. Y01 TaxID=2729613 RepID=UPI00145C9486|nr:formate dehydrogenase subunit gamma [Thalassotalea sp. Y01]NMP17261.1 formate dehydrogenase subunit gamma [Thalassotalea sp. Y01]